MLPVGGTYHDWGWVIVLGSLHYLYLFVINYNGLSLLTSLVSYVSIAVVVSVLLFGVVNLSLHQK